MNLPGTSNNHMRLQQQRVYNNNQNNTSEKEILSDELEAVSESRERLRSRLNECEEAVRNLREQVQVQERLPEEVWCGVVRCGVVWCGAV